MTDVGGGKPDVAGVAAQLELTQEAIRFILSFLHPAHEGGATATPEQWHAKVHEMLAKFGGRMTP